jgi:cell division septum initiation protein DivIVA
MQVTAAAPQAPIPPGAVITVNGNPLAFSGAPRTLADVAALKARREELSTQLSSATGRRQSLSRQLVGKDGIDRAGLESHITVLDKRITQLESDLAETGRQLSMTPGYLVASSRSASQFYGMNPNGAAAIGIIFTFFVLVPMALSVARSIWKRANAPPAPPAISGEAARRLERLEQGMDAIAIEIERVSEGQRFVTRLLSEAHTNAPLAIPRQAAEEASASTSHPIR